MRNIQWHMPETAFTSENQTLRWEILQGRFYSLPDFFNRFQFVAALIDRRRKRQRSMENAGDGVGGVQFAIRSMIPTPRSRGCPNLKTSVTTPPGNWAYHSFTTPGSPMEGDEMRAKMRAGAPLKDKAKAFPTAVCASCHQASAAEDMVFTQFYPVLRAAKAAAK